MKINLTQKLTFAALILTASCLHAEHESTEPPRTINTIQMSVSVLSKILSNSHYKVIGACTWAVGKLPPRLEPSPSVEQFLPDLIVTVSNKPEENPWFEARTLFENATARSLYQKTYSMGTGFPLGFGDDAGQTTSMHINDERTRVVDVIGSPAVFYQIPYLSHTPETRFGQPYYISEADAVMDRNEMAEITYMATHPHLLVNHDIGTWGHEIPRLMRVTQPSRFRASVVAAMHAVDIVTNRNSLHVTKSTTNTCGKNCVVSNATYDPREDHVIWQEIYPINRNIKPGDANDSGIEDEKEGNGNYVFVVWRKYRGCIPHEGKLMKALSSPHVGKPQKR
jgi:integrating conjugative element protein (TIGR03756 family)